jgi:phosphonate transport system permease protein
VATPNVPLSPPPDRDALLSPWPKTTIRGVLIGATLLGLYAWGVAGTEVRPARLIDGIPNVVDFVQRLFPPLWKTEETRLGPTGLVVAVPEVAFAIVETIQMAVVGTSLAIVISLPFGLLAARNTSPHRLVYVTMRFFLNMVRAVPELILALMFVAAVGLGPFGGVMALAVGATGFMGKLYAEAIEAIDPQQVMAVAATGASRAHTFVYGVLPQALPIVASYSLLLFETNVRSASVLGIVGAGGVGFVLTKYMALFQYRYLMGAMLLIILVVTCIDRLSDAIRKRLT